MMRTKKFYIATLAFTLVVCALITVVNICSINFTQPHPDLESSELEGIWITHYSRGTTDTITLNSDGTFRQVFEDSRRDYVFDSGWNSWTLERLQSGEIRLHLQGGRFYLEDIQLAERNGRRDPDNPCLDVNCKWGLQPDPFYDPFANELVEMVDKLVLVVLLDSRDNLILHHVWSTSDRGFLLFDKDMEYFKRSDNP
jgi:hypothetical protein